ncbi:hypothetical protein IBX73_05615 [candidate division WOR-3 bacterium]|nr:hypothetical protein [candidate division WOR-3 bacterium]
MIQALLVFLTGLTLPGITSQGDRFLYHDARSAAMGGVSIVLESTANPASLALFNDKAVFFSGRLAVQSERRGLRVYDSFGNNIGIATLANNTATYAGPGPCAFIFPLRFISFGLQYAPVWDHNYYYREEHRDDFYQLTSIDELSYSGYLNALAPMVSFRYRSISVGLEQDFLFGALQMTRTVIMPDADSVYREETELAGRKTRFGASITPSINFRLAYTYQHSYALDNGGDEYPSTHAFGVMYQPPGRIPTRFAGQIEYEIWDELWERNILIYKLGVEHMIQSKYYMRYGFCIFPDYTQAALWTTNLTAGFGLNAGRYSVDLGYAYGKRDYLAGDFPYLDFTSDYVFDETGHHLLITAGVHF